MSVQLLSRDNRGNKGVSRGSTTRAPQPVRADSDSRPQQVSESLRAARHVGQIAAREVVGQHLLYSTVLGSPAAAGERVEQGMRNIAGLLGLKVDPGLRPAEIIRAAEAATGAFDS